MRGLDCIYEFARDSTKQHYLHTQIRSKDEQLAKLKSVLDLLQRGSDAEATDIYIRLRMGEGVEQLVGDDSCNFSR
jgi:hypothetical protein